MIQLLIASPEPDLDLLLQAAAVSDPFLVELVATDLLPLAFRDDCDADFACFWAPTVIRMTDTLIVTNPEESDAVGAQKLAFTVGSLIVLNINGTAQVERVRASLDDWSVAILERPVRDGGSPSA